jgi:hypothetical protein
MGRSARSVIAGRRAMSGNDRTCCWIGWISGARRSIPMTWVTRARVMPSRRAMAAWLGGLAGRQQGLPLDGLAEELHHPGRLGLLGRLRLAPAGRGWPRPPGRRAHGASGGRCCRFRRPPWAPERSRPSVRGRRPRARRPRRPRRRGRCGTRSRAPPSLGGHVEYCYIQRRKQQHLAGNAAGGAFGNNPWPTSAFYFGPP